MLLLRDVFDYDYDRVAEIVGRSETNCRQIMTRARVRVREHRARFDASPQRRDELVARFFDACQSGDLAGLEKVLAEDITFIGDGGGKAPALRAPVDGRRRVARFLLGLFRVATAEGPGSIRYGSTAPPGRGCSARTAGSPRCSRWISTTTASTASTTSSTRTS